LSAEGFPAEAVPGGTGQFDVLRDGQKVFSKGESGRFPDEGEILAALRA
jgi:selT/selW/selH-like putative selenoprotein